MLGEGGHIRLHFGGTDLDIIDRRMLRAWWLEVSKRRNQQGKLIGTDAKRNYLNALSAVFDHADVANPVREFRQTKLARNARTKAARAERADHANPLTVAELHRLFAALEQYRTQVRVGRGKPRSLKPAERRARQQVYAVTVLLLDCGLRLGEALGGLYWEDIEPGRLNIRRSLSRGRYLGTTKSGRSRTVELSARAGKALRDWRSVCGTLGRDGAVFDLGDANYRRAWRQLFKAAEIPSRNGREPKPKDLRDSYASHLLTLGIPIGYISRQLGHAGTSVTEQRYARWVGDASAYRQGPDLAGRSPADLLASLLPEDCHANCHNGDSGTDQETLTS
jgi:integrase